VAIYVTSVACYRALREQGRIDRVLATAGLSLGEFTALHLAGAFTFVNGLSLVRLRGEAMQAAAEASPGGMVAVTGLGDEHIARDICAKALDGHGGEVLVPANFNSSIQIVLSGSKPACERAAKIAEEMGYKPTMLAVAGAFHSPLMQPAADRLAAALNKIEWDALRCPVVSNVTAAPHEGDIKSIKRLLVEQLTSPVRWASSMQWIVANLPGQLVELAPGKTLAGLMRRIDKDAKVQNHAEPG
jgi:[acyl-carrier-protein] S-malonyltransferase